MFNKKEWNINNREKTREYDKRWRMNNLEKVKEYQRQYRINNPEKVKESARQWCINNVEHKREWEKQKYNTDLKYNLNTKIRKAIWQSLKNNKNGRQWEDIVGYSCIELIKRLKKTMPKGFIWKDFLYGELHIDHIIPKVAFDLKEIKDCWSLYNLQLLPTKDNLSKKDNITNPILLGLLINNERSIKSYAI